MRTSNICGILTLLLLSLSASALPFVGPTSLIRRFDPTHSANAAFPLDERETIDRQIEKLENALHDANMRAASCQQELMYLANVGHRIEQQDKELKAVILEYDRLTAQVDVILRGIRTLIAMRSRIWGHES